MKRLLPSAILALVVHAIILSNDYSWLKFSASPIPAAKSLSITLAANKPHRHTAQAAVTPQPIKRHTVQIPREIPAVMSTSAPVGRAFQLEKPMPTPAAKNSVKQIRRKKSLKALTFKKQRIKTATAAPAMSDTQHQIVLKPEATVLQTINPVKTAVRQMSPAKSVFIDKTHHLPGPSEPMITAAAPSSKQSDPARSGPVLRRARPLYKQNASPSYPRKARRLGYEGTVMLKVLIDETGRVDDLTVLQSSGHAVLDDAALSAVKKWLFEPGTEGGIKTKMWVKIPIRFDLK